MRRFFTALKAGARAAAGTFGPGEFQIAKRKVRCSHCGGRQFTHRHVDNQDIRSLPFGTTALICVECSHIELFGEVPTLV